MRLSTIAFLGLRHILPLAKRQIIRNVIRNSKNIFLSYMQKTEFKNNYFDVVVGRFSLHYLAKFDLAYIEILRILKRGGCLIFVAHHPFKDLMMQKVKEYGKKEVIRLDLYCNKVPIYFPTHTLQDYFSKSFFKYFCIDNFQEEQSPEEYLDEFRLPGFIGVKTIKK